MVAVTTQLVTAGPRASGSLANSTAYSVAMNASWASAWGKEKK